MQKKKWLWFILPVCAALGLLLFAVTRHTQHATGHMKLTVVDAYSFRAVPNAQIVLPEAGLSTVSDANGIAYLYGVPVHAPEVRLEPSHAITGKRRSWSMRKDTCRLRCSTPMFMKTACATGPRCTCFQKAPRTALTLSPSSSPLRRTG